MLNSIGPKIGTWGRPSLIDRVLLNFSSIAIWRCGKVRWNEVCKIFWEIIFDELIDKSGDPDFIKDFLEVNQENNRDFFAVALLGHICDYSENLKYFVALWSKLYIVYIFSFS